MVEDVLKKEAKNLLENCNEEDLRKMEEYGKVRKSYLSPGGTRIKLSNTLPDMEEVSAGVEPGEGDVEEVFEYLLEDHEDDDYYDKLQEVGVGPSEVRMLFRNVYQAAKEAGYEEGDLAEELGITSSFSGLRSEPVQTQEDEETLPLKELPEVFDRTYATLRGWLNRKNLSDYSIRNGKAHEFGKKSLESFVLRELTPSSRFSSSEIKCFYERIADRFGEEPTPIPIDLEGKDDGLASGKKYELLQETLREEKLKEAIEENCTDQEQEYVRMNLEENIKRKDIADEEGVKEQTISEHIQKGVDKVWEATKS